MRTKQTARSVALETLIQIFNKNSYSNIALNNRLKKANLSEIDQNLTTKIVYGTIQYKIFLEYQLKNLIKTRIKDQYMIPLLLLSAYQLLFLDKIPARAVLDEANKLAKEYGRHNSSGYKVINGVLRALTRRGAILPAQNDIIHYLSIKESFPKWIVQYCVNNWDIEQAKQILASFNEEAKNSIRISKLAKKESVVNELKKDGFNPQASSVSGCNLILTHGGIANNILFKQGKVTIQDESASLAVAAFNFTGNEQVLDACSAPGGKTVQIAENLTSGKVYALDIHQKKLNLVRQNAERMGVSECVKTIAIDARKSDEYFLNKKFAKILVDAPCSGLGLMRRKPEIRYTKNKSDLKQLQGIQLDILDHVSRLLEKNGELVYSTCTISKEEDEQVVERFLRDHPQFELKPYRLEKIDVPTGMLKIMPNDYGSDGFFIAKFKIRG